MNNSNERLKKQLLETKNKLVNSENNNLLLDQNIKKAHQEWIASLDMFEDLIFIHDKNFLILRCNDAYQQKAGIPYTQIIGHPYFDIFPKTHAPLKNCLSSMENSAENWSDETLPIGDFIYHSRAYVARDENQNYLYSMHILEDITKRIEIQKALQTSEAQYRRLFEAAKDGILILDAETGIIVDANPFILNLAGYTLIELIGKNLWEIGFIADIAASKISFHDLQNNEYIRYEDLPIKTKDGREVNVEFVSNVYLVNRQRVIQCNIRDITERTKAKQVLKESEEKFHSITRTAQDAIIIMNDEGIITYWNESATNMFGYTIEEAIGKALHPLLAPEQFHEAHRIGFSHFIKTGEGPAIGKTIELIALKKDGSEFPIELSLSGNKKDGKWEAIGIIRDITERKRTDDLIRRSNRALRTLSAGNMALVQARSEGELLQSVTDVIVKEGGYSLAVVDYAEDNPEKTITPMAWSGLIWQNDWIKVLSWSETSTNQMPVSKVIRTAITQVTRNIAEESEFTLWRDNAIARGYAASIALPLMDGEKVFGALNIYASEANVFSEEEVEEIRLLEELANDLAYGIITLRTRASHERQEMILRESLEQSIQTIAATVEARDPYTAGHQKHVSELATAIAKEMGLSEEQVNGVHLAAIIHDLGKIHIPAEILSRPGKLSNIEFMLIQTHPQSGYDILKDVKFPWPIADIILQHHEKIDGSGYPQGLKGNQILLEAKIISVADVVEAISSHRPYRAALGIEAALDEIKKGRGIIYEASVVDACLKLITEKGFVFSTH